MAPGSADSPEQFLSAPACDHPNSSSDLLPTARKGSRRVGSNGRFQRPVVEPAVIELVTDFFDDCSPFADPAHDFASKIPDSTDMLHSTGALSDYVAEMKNSIPFRFRRFCNLPTINSSVEHIQDIPPIQDLEKYILWMNSR